MMMRPTFKRIFTLSLAISAGLLGNLVAHAQAPNRDSYRSAPSYAPVDDGMPDDSTPAPRRSTEPPRAGSKAYLEQRKAAEAAAAEPVRPSATARPTGPTRGYADGSQQHPQQYPAQRTSATTSNPKYRMAQRIDADRETPMDGEMPDPKAHPRPAAPVEDIGPRRMSPQSSSMAPAEPTMHDQGAVSYGPEPMAGEGGCGCNGGSCGGSCTSGGCRSGCCGGCGNGGCGICIGLCDCSFLDNLTIFAGPDAYKGPLDRAANGNFGFHEGLNTGFAVCDCLGWGVQIGAELTQADFETGVLATDHRDQVFVTGGAFHRPACGNGFTAGVVADYMHDDFYVSLDLLQVRSMVGYSWCSNEVGFEGIVGVDQQTVNTAAFGQETFAARDQYRFYYKRTWCEGAESRSFVGFTGDKDFEVGSELRAPLSPSLAVQGAFTYLIPDQNNRLIPNETESWNVGMSLVWHPYQRAHCYGSDPYRPMFNVADNGSFLQRLKR